MFASPGGLPTLVAALTIDQALAEAAAVLELDRHGDANAAPVL